MYVINAVAVKAGADESNETFEIGLIRDSREGHSIGENSDQDALYQSTKCF